MVHWADIAIFSDNICCCIFLRCRFGRMGLGPPSKPILMVFASAVHPPPPPPSTILTDVNCCMLLGLWLSYQPACSGLTHPLWCLQLSVNTWNGKTIVFYEQQQAAPCCINFLWSRFFTVVFQCDLATKPLVRTGTNQRRNGP